MRFKKLKIFVEIAIIIFILVAGNVIVFGLIQGKQSSKVKNPSLELPVVTIEKENPIVQKQKGEEIDEDSEDDNEQSATTTAPQISSTPRTIRHRRRRSRAS